MNLKRKLSLTLSIFMVLLACFALVLYEDAHAAVIGASSASLIAPTYTVGSEFAGTVDQQLVQQGDTVKAGEKLFTVKSTQLLSELNSGQLSSASLPGQLTPDDSLIILASHSGVMGKIAYLAGSFVPAGQTIATINGNTGLEVEADFELSGPQYARVTPSTELHVKLGGQDETVRITGIDQRASNGHIFTIIDGTLPDVSNGQTLYATGTSLPARIVLTHHTLYEALLTDVKKRT